MGQMIYFDHNSTTSYSPSVRNYLEKDLSEDWYNAFAAYPKAQILSQKINECRSVIAHHLNGSPKNLFFTSGGTESINTVLSLGTLKLNRLNSFIASPMDHHAVIKRIQYLCDENTPAHWIHSNENGEINLKELEIICEHHPHSMISFLSANNETGVTTNIQTATQIAKKYKCLVHVDAVQSLGKMPIDLKKWDVDFASFSGHKIGSMKGIGLLYAKKPFVPLMHGGEQERSLRPGTQNYPAIQSFKLAVEDIDTDKQMYVKDLRDYLENQIAINIPSFEINCQKASRIHNTSNIYCKGMSSYEVTLGLAQKGIYISVGSACNAGTSEPSHVLTEIAKAMKKNSTKDYARSCIRVSLSSSNTKLEVDTFLYELKKLYAQKFHQIPLSI